MFRTMGATAALFTAVLSSTSPVSGHHQVPNRQLSPHVVGCVVPSPLTYDFVETYNPACSAFTNYGQNLSDLQATNTVDGTAQVSVTKAVSMGGATTSLKINSTEFVASGGHGESWGWNYHAYNSGASASECYNPTQNGSAQDDTGSAPWHGASSAKISRWAIPSAGVLTSSSQLAMFVRSGYGGYGGCVSTAPVLAPYALATTTTLSGNVVHEQATLTSSDSLHASFDGNYKAYLQRQFTTVYTFDPATQTVGTLSNGTGSSLVPQIRCTADGAWCLGMVFNSATMPGAYYWSQNQPVSSYNPYGEQSTQVSAPASNVGPGTAINYDVYSVVGNLTRVESGITTLHTTLGI